MITQSELNAVKSRARKGYWLEPREVIKRDVAALLALVDHLQAGLAGLVQATRDERP